jgi:hypothetical protein
LPPLLRRNVLLIKDKTAAARHWKTQRPSRRMQRLRAGQMDSMSSCRMRLRSRFEPLVEDVAGTRRPAKRGPSKLSHGRLAVPPVELDLPGARSILEDIGRGGSCRGEQHASCSVMGPSDLSRARRRRLSADARSLGIQFDGDRGSNCLPSALRDCPRRKGPFREVGLFRPYRPVRKRKFASARVNRSEEEVLNSRIRVSMNMRTCSATIRRARSFVLSMDLMTGRFLFVRMMRRAAYRG